MIDRDESNDLSFNPYSPLNPEGLKGRTYAKWPTDGLNTRTAIPLVELDWQPYKMPDIPRKEKAPEIRGVSNWASAEWQGQRLFRGVVSVSQGCKRFVFYVPNDFPLKDVSIEEQLKYFNLNQH